MSSARRNTCSRRRCSRSYRKSAPPRPGSRSQSRRQEDRERGVTLRRAIPVSIPAAISAGICSGSRVRLFKVAAKSIPPSGLSTRCRQLRQAAVRRIADRPQRRQGRFAPFGKFRRDMRFHVDGGAPVAACSAALRLRASCTVASAPVKRQRRMFLSSTFSFACIVSDKSGCACHVFAPDTISSSNQQIVRSAMSDASPPARPKLITARTLRADRMSCQNVSAAAPDRRRCRSWSRHRRPRCRLRGRSR